MGIALRSRSARRAAALALVAPLVAAPLMLLAGTATAQTANEVKATAANRFEPAKLEIKVGDTVTWTMEGFHSVTGGKPGQPDAASPMKGPASDQPYKATFEEAGTFPYYCQPHETLGMVGEIVVTKEGPKGGGTAPTATPTAAEPVKTGPPASKDPNLGQATRTILEKRKAQPEKEMSGFRYLLWGLTAATLVLSAAVFASTRPRREG